MNPCAGYLGHPFRKWARRRVLSRAICPFPERMSQVASTGPSSDLRPVFPVHHLIKGLALLGRLRLVVGGWICKRANHETIHASRQMKNLARPFGVMHPGHT